MSSTTTNGNGNGWSRNLPVLTGFGMLILVMVGGFWSLANPSESIRDIRTNYLTKSEHAEFQRRLQEHFTRVEASIEHLREAQVPRNELQARAESSARQFSEIRREIDDMRKLVGTDYTLRDKIIELQNRINVLTDRLIPPSKGASP